MGKEYFRMFLDWLAATLKSRVFWVGVVITAFMGILVVRLYNLQILNGADYYDTYIERTRKDILTPSTRGNIYDRNGVLLAGNELSYDITIRYTEDYATSNGELNEMLLRLIGIMEEYGREVVTELPVVLNEYGQFEYSGTNAAIRQFIRDTYGTTYIENQEKEGVDVYSFDAETVMERLMTVAYNFNSKWPGHEEVSREDALAVCNIRYAMRSTVYTKYKSTVICRDISPELQTAILENQAKLLGVSIEESEKRVYPDGVYFSNILGYTGKPNSEELALLKEEDDTYESTDLVGKEGLEQYYELELSGTKGVDSVYLKNTGLILEVIDSIPAKRGNDIYLTIDHDLQKAVYHLLEQRLSEVIIEKLTIEEFKADNTTLAGEFQIPVHDVYYQVISNHLLDIDHFTAEDATDNEREIAAIFASELEVSIDHICSELLSGEAPALSEYPEDFQEYLNYIYDMLRGRNVLQITSEAVSDQVFNDWKNGNISLRAFLQYAVSSGWIDTSKLELESKYADSQEAYERLTDRIRAWLADDPLYAALVYETLIDSDRITGNRICMALIDQGVLKAQEADYEALSGQDPQVAFDFIRDKIARVEITPAQLALDPCSGACIVTDTDTGDVLALVSYPGYDINKLSGTVDSVYWRKLINDQSEPLYNKATQVRTAPGSTYKLVTAVAGLEEGVIGPMEEVDCVGTFDKLDNPKCWIARETEGGMHGPLYSEEAIAQSCNFYFYEIGYRLSLNEEGEYVASKGLENLRKYAEKFGFGSLSGLEITENPSQISTEYPVTSAIGQGMNNMTAVSLSRYATALATNGRLYKYQLMKKLTDSDGETLYEKEPEYEQIEGVSDSTWNIVRNGMYGVTHEGGTASYIFEDMDIDVAGKSGSAQENLLRANHGIFVTYAPINDPEISVIAMIPHGYQASNAGTLCRYVYQYYYHSISMDDVLSHNYSDVGGSTAFSD